MEKLIKDKLKEIEIRENVKIILAVESGSRAWGFESPDSDYDVRFLYIRQPEDYLKLEGVRDVIEWQLDDVLDINGWDINKALRLLYKSNPTFFEWCESPVVYHKTEEFEMLPPVMSKYFSKKRTLFHYWHMASTNYREYLKEDWVKAKKYFYVIRPILAAHWVLSHESTPPMAFSELVESELPEDLKLIISELLKQKMSADELTLVPKIQELNDYIETSLIELEKIAKSIEDEPVKEWTKLNQLFLEYLECVRKE